MVSMLVEYGADVNIPQIQGHTPLHLVFLHACAGFKKHKAEVLLRHGANPIALNYGDIPLPLGTRLSHQTSFGGTPLM